MRIFILALLLSGITFSEAQANTRYSEDYESYPYTQPLPSGQAGSSGNEKQWSGVVGAGAISMPEYLGANDNEVRFLPMIDIEYKQRYFLSTQRGLGFYFFRDNRFALATMVNMDWGRDESDNARLRGLGDLDPSAQLGVDLKWYINKWLSFDVDAYQAISPGGHEGAYGNVGFGGRWPVAKNFAFRANTGIRWASDTYMSNMFGVNATQSARSGLAQFNPDSALMAWQFGAALDFNLSPQWFVSPTFRYIGLLGDAADSPITQDDGQYYAGVFLGYKF
ncbi:MAG TPA: MipA/OmpV family protein [Alphaproteobacteria bacterium]|nr:hypothetical protein [Rhodospirillaceae bacterium]HRJ13232.1 MipA/OmpV family protein [Alphaproteobacteria bacterium]